MTSISRPTESIITATSSERTFRLGQTMRLATFQIGSAMGDILVASIWNRVMVADLGMPAWPVSLLIALRYLLAPLSLWAGHRSDTHPLWGWYRTSYIWCGRLMVVLSFPLLAASLNRFELNRADGIGWLIALVCFLLYGTGTLISGSPFLALVRDAAPPEKRGFAITTMEMTLITLFPFVAIGFSVWIRTYDPNIFWQMVTVSMLVGGFFWFFAIVGVEPRKPTARTTTMTQSDLHLVFRQLWQDPRTRGFFAFLSLATLAAWAQDAILEPFGAEVFAQTLGQTTRYSAYWQGATVITLITTAILGRKRHPAEQSRLASTGLSIMALGMALLAVSAWFSHIRVMQIALVIFGVGFGIYSFGGLNLMAAMTADGRAGAYLGLWTIAILVSRGVGISLGGIIRDVFHALNSSPALTYGGVFALEAIGLAVAVWLLSRVDVKGFARDHSTPTHTTRLEGLEL